MNWDDTRHGVTDLPAAWDDLAADFDNGGVNPDDASGDKRVAATLRSCADQLRYNLAKQAPQ